MGRKKAMAGFVLLIFIFLFYLSISKREQLPPSTSPGEKKDLEITNEKAVSDTQNEEVIKKKQDSDIELEDSTKRMGDDSISGPKLIVTGAVTLEDGYSIAGALVEMHERKGMENAPVDKLIVQATTDDNGHYRLVTRDLPEFLLTASHPSYAKICDYVKNDSSASPVQKKDAIRRITHDFILLSAAPIKGKVVDEKDRPLPKVVVSAVSLERKRITNKILTICNTVTNEQGLFTIMDTKAGEHTLCIDHGDYVPLRQPVNAPAGGLILRLESGGALVSGHVYLKSTGEAVPDAGVEMKLLLKSSKFISPPPATCKTDRNGAFLIDKLMPGSYLLDAGKNDLHLLPSQNPKGHEIVLSEKENKTGIKLFLYMGHNIRGKVYDKDTNTPLEGAKVSVIDNAIETKFSDVTDDKGFYLLTGVYQPQISLLAVKEGYLQVRKDRLEPYIAFSLTPDPLEVTRDIPMRRKVSISGKVQTEDGNPATQAEVSLYSVEYWDSQRQFTPVDSSGAFTIDSPPFVTTKVTARAPNYPPAFSDPIEVRDFPITNIIITLKKGALLKGTVVDTGEKPIQGVEIRALIHHDFWYEGFEEIQTAFSDETGNFSLIDLPAQLILLIAEKTGYAPNRMKDIALSSGEEKTGVKIVMKTSAFIAGKITNKEGRPIEGVRIYARNGYDREYSRGMDFSGLDGRYRIQNLLNEPHMVSLFHPDYGYKSHDGIEVDRDGADFVMDTMMITFLGRLVEYKTGEPVKNFNVISNIEAVMEKEPGLFKVFNLQPDYSYYFTIESPDFPIFETGEILLPKDKDFVEMTFTLGKGGAITGKVVKRSSKEPFAGVNVYLKGTGTDWQVAERAPLMTFVTQEDGYFVFDNVSKGTNMVEFQPPSPFPILMKRIDVDYDKTSDFGEVEIGDGGMIRGKVVQLPDDVPLSGTSVELLKNFTMEKFMTAVTDENGAFEFSKLLNDDYRLYVPDYKLSQDLRLGDNEIQECILRVGAGALKGLVLRKGTPLSAHIMLRQTNLDRRKHMDTNPAGEFEIRDLAPGRWKVTITSQENQEVAIEEMIDIVAQGITEKTFVFPSGRIVGRVIDIEENSVAQAKITAILGRPSDMEESLSPRAWNAFTTEDGSFSIDDLFPDLYSVSATKEDMGLALQENVIVPQEGDSQPVILQLGKTEGGTLVSVALNMSSGEPVPQAWCYLTNKSGVRFEHGQTRNQEGLIRIPNIPQGEYLAQVSSYGFSVHERMVEIKTGEVLEIEDVLYEAGALRWTVMDKNGAPLQDALCKSEPLDPNSIEQIRTGKTDKNGLWIQRGLFPGEYRVTSTLSDGRNVSEIVLIKAKELTQREVTVGG